MSNPPERPFQPPAPPAGQSPQGQYPMQPQPSYYANPSVTQRPMIYADSGPKGLSIASMVIGFACIVGFAVFVVPQIVGVILGHLALRREPSGRGMAVTGLVLNYLFIAIAVVVISFLILGFWAAASNHYR